MPARPGSAAGPVDGRRPSGVTGVEKRAVEEACLSAGARQAYLIHDAVTGIDTGSAGYALVLQAVTDVDAGGTHLHAQCAVDAIAQPGLLLVDVLAPHQIHLGRVGDAV